MHWLSARERVAGAPIWKADKDMRNIITNSSKRPGIKDGLCYASSMLRSISGEVKFNFEFPLHVRIYISLETYRRFDHKEILVSLSVMYLCKVHLFDEIKHWPETMSSSKLLLFQRKKVVILKLRLQIQSEVFQSSMKSMKWLIMNRSVRNVYIYFQTILISNYIRLNLKIAFSQKSASLSYHIFLSWSFK